MMEWVECRKCGDTLEIQIGTEEHANGLCFICFDEQEEEINGRKA